MAGPWSFEAESDRLTREIVDEYPASSLNPDGPSETLGAGHDLLTLHLGQDLLVVWILASLTFTVAA